MGLYPMIAPWVKFNAQLQCYKIQIDDIMSGPKRGFEEEIKRVYRFKKENPDCPF